MAVIINEFEIIPEEPPAAAESSDQKSSQQPGPASAALTPADIAELACHQAERETRLRAH